MEQFGSVDDILDFAISNEEESLTFYKNLANTMKNEQMREVFEEFAREEKKHKEKLVEAKQGNFILPSRGKILDLKLSDYLVDVEQNSEMEYQSALILAMKKEKKAFMLYMDLADKADNTSTKNLFLFLAQEEAKHKLRIEIEYDATIFSEN